MENHTPEGSGLKSFLDDTFQTMDTVLSNQHAELRQSEIGVVEYVGYGIVRVGGLPNIKAEELVLFPKNLQGLVFNIDPDEIGVILLGSGEGLQTGAEVKRTGRILDTPVGDDLIGRTLDAVGRPLDNLGEIRPDGRMPVEREAPAVMDRDPVTVPLQTGIKVIDALIPIGRGQRELIVGDRQTGKTAIAIDTIINQFDKGVLCIYCAIGKKTSDVAKVIADLKDHGAMGHTILVVATAGDPPGLQYIAPYAATTMGEYFMSRGKDVLIVYDDLTNHARAYRELSLLLRRPPGREAFPGDIFYIHSRLLERSTHLKKDHGGGSLTAIPIVETEAQDISSYIPTNLISITDGQIYLSPRLFQKGILPAVDVGKSVSRVGGKAQLPAYRAVAGDLRIAYSQFEELETFSRFGTRLDEGTRKVLERGWRVREILKQSQYDPIRVSDQIAALLAVTSGALDVIAADKVAQTESALREAMKDHHADLGHRIEAGEKLDESDRKIITDAAGETVQRLKGD